MQIQGDGHAPAETGVREDPDPQVDRQAGQEENAEGDPGAVARERDEPGHDGSEQCEGTDDAEDAAGNEDLRAAYD